MRPLIVVFAKAPVPGRVKTRLDPDPLRTAELHTAFVRDTLVMLRDLCDVADVELSTDVSTAVWADLAPRQSVQAEGDLGERMYAALDGALQEGRTAAMILGSDSPMLPSGHIRELLRSSTDVTLGPTEDGGYYALACRRVAAGMFARIRWSTSATFADTIKGLSESALSCGAGPGWFDVDRPADLGRLHQLLMKPPLCSRAIRLRAVVERRKDLSGFLLDPEEADGLEDFLRKAGWLLSERVVSVARIGDGNMNLTVRVRTNHRTFVLKQARPWVEKYPDIAAPAGRAAVEAAFFRIAAQQPVVSARMPRLLGFDHDSNLLMLEDLGERAGLMSLYLSGDLGGGTCRLLVDYLSSLHEIRVPSQEVETLRNREMRRLNHEHQYDLPLREHNGLDLDRITPGLAYEAGRLKADREYCAHVGRLGRGYLADGPTLVHGDFFPGSWLQTDRGPAVIDPEFCFLGPREYDLGIFLAHLVLIRAESLWSLVETCYNGPVDWTLARRFAGAEIMRRLIGVAQLPVPPPLDKKREWLKLSRSLVCA